MAVTIQVDLHHSFPRTFLPAGADMGNWVHVEPLLQELLRRNPSTAPELEQWLVDCSELFSAFSEERARRYIAMTTQTDDPAREAAYQQFAEEIVPKFKPLVQELEKAYLGNPARRQLPRDRYALLDRKTENAVNLFREENIPLELQDTLLSKDYQKIQGAVTINVDGQEVTAQQAAKFLEQPDRAMRQQVWERLAARRLQDKDAVEGIYDQLVKLRTQIAANTGFSNYRDYVFARRERFDYTPEHCFDFHQGVERAVLPLVREIQSQRLSQLGVESLRPWDGDVDPLNRPPLRPFSTAAELVAGVKQIFARVHPGLGEQFDFMDREGLLELENRKGKAPGGYQSTLNERRVPFIFMNAVGRDYDVRTLLHEGGHAFHMLAARQEPLISYRHAPLEFCEVASMGMELLAAPHLEVFYKDPQERNRAYRQRLEEIVVLLPWIAVIDAFQHWVYTHPEHTREQRAAAWLETHQRFSTLVDWTGYEEQRTYMWHRQPHLFTSPFYYIEYGIAQIGALQVWMRSRSDYSGAVERYWSALTLGGTRSLPELFAAAGGSFRFDYAALQPLMDAIASELERLSP